MTDPQQTVFISYRRSTSRHLARAVFMDLRANGWDAFLDVNTIDSGAFDSVILNQIAARAHFVILMSPGAFERCADESDWLRREIEEALRLERNIVPIIEEGVDFQRETQYLPETIRETFSKQNGVRLFHDYFEEGLEKLRTRFLKQRLQGRIVTAPTSDQPVVQQKIADAEAEGAPTREELSAEQYFNRAFRHITLHNDYVAAIADYTEAIRLNPQYFGAYSYRGDARFAQGDVDGALKDYQEALRQHGNHRNSMLGIGNCYYAKGMAREALTYYESYLRIGGNSATNMVRQRIAELKKKVGA